jgi:hypothetical protein
MFAMKYIGKGQLNMGTAQILNGQELFFTRITGSMYRVQQTKSRQSTIATINLASNAWDGKWERIAR